MPPSTCRARLYCGWIDFIFFFELCPIFLLLAGNFFCSSFPKAFLVKLGI